MINNQVNVSLLYTIESHNFEESNQDKHWINAMNDELDQIKKNETQDLVPIEIL
jgi:hypothetical protein